MEFYEKPTGVKLENKIINDWILILIFLTRTDECIVLKMCDKKSVHNKTFIIIIEYIFGVYVI